MSKLSSPARPTWESVQWLRAAAALLVVWHHVREQFDPIRERFPSEFGGTGVDVFFVISGFIMMLITRPGQGPCDFLKKRVARVAPLYWGATSLLAGICLFAPSLLHSVEFTWSHYLKSLAFVPHHAPDGRIKPLLSLGWTLNYEMFFYLVFACFVFLSPLRRLIGMTVALGAMITAGALIQSRNAAWTIFTDPIMLEFLCGMGLAYIATKGVKAPRIVGLSLLVLGLCMLPLLAPLYETGTHRVVAFGGPAILIVAGGVMLEPHWPKSRLMVLIGDASYSLYLSHIFTLGAVRTIWSKLQLPVEGWGMAAFVIVAMSASVIAGIIVHLVIEKPISKWVHHKLYTPPARAVAASL